jgi:hypothetical protein
VSQTYCFSVQADACPSALPRVLEVFSLFGSVPETCYARLAGRGHDELVVDVQMNDLDSDTAERIARRLGRVVSVQSVLWSAKHEAAAA